MSLKDEIGIYQQHRADIAAALRRARADIAGAENVLDGTSTATERLTQLIEAHSQPSDDESTASDGPEMAPVRDALLNLTAMRQRLTQVSSGAYEPPLFRDVVMFNVDTGELTRQGEEGVLRLEPVEIPKGLEPEIPYLSSTRSPGRTAGYLTGENKPSGIIAQHIAAQLESVVAQEAAEKGVRPVVVLTGASTRTKLVAAGLALAHFTGTDPALSWDIEGDYLSGRERTGGTEPLLPGVSVVLASRPDANLTEEQQRLDAEVKAARVVTQDARLHVSQRGGLAHTAIQTRDVARGDRAKLPPNPAFPTVRLLAHDLRRVEETLSGVLNGFDGEREVPHPAMAVDAATGEVAMAHFEKAYEKPLIDPDADGVSFIRYDATKPNRTGVRLQPTALPSELRATGETAAELGASLAEGLNEFRLQQRQDQLRKHEPPSNRHEGAKPTAELRAVSSEARLPEVVLVTNIPDGVSQQDFVAEFRDTYARRIRKLNNYAPVAIPEFIAAPEFAETAQTGYGEFRPTQRVDLGAAERGLSLPTKRDRVTTPGTGPARAVVPPPRPARPGRRPYTPPPPREPMAVREIDSETGLIADLSSGEHPGAEPELSPALQELVLSQLSAQGRLTDVAWSDDPPRLVGILVDEGSAPEANPTLVYLREETVRPLRTREYGPALRSEVSQSVRTTATVSELRDAGFEGPIVAVFMSGTDRRDTGQVWQMVGSRTSGKPVSVVTDHAGSHELADLLGGKENVIGDVEIAAIASPFLSLVRSKPGSQELLTLQELAERGNPPQRTPTGIQLPGAVATVAVDSSATVTPETLTELAAAAADYPGRKVRATATLDIPRQDALADRDLETRSLARQRTARGKQAEATAPFLKQLAAAPGQLVYVRTGRAGVVYGLASPQANVGGPAVISYAKPGVLAAPSGNEVVIGSLGRARVMHRDGFEVEKVVAATPVTPRQAQATTRPSPPKSA